MSGMSFPSLNNSGLSFRDFFSVMASRTAGQRTSCIRVDFPEPEIPVITVRRPNGIRTSIFLRLFARAPLISIHLSTFVSERRDLRNG